MGQETVRFGIDAPVKVAVHRRKIYEQIREENRAAPQTSQRVAILADRSPEGHAALGARRRLPQTPVKCVDWREADRTVVAPLYAAEQARWATELDWDTAANWVLVETARAQRTLPGYLALDRGGAVAGWAFYYLHDEVLQIGGLTGRTNLVARHILDTIMRSPEAARARDVAYFVLPDRPATGAFVQRRFDALTFLYLRRRIDWLTPNAVCLSDGVMQPQSQAPGLRPWDAQDDAADTIRLMDDAYGTSTSARCFAGRGGLGGWVHYVRQLIHTPACGVLLPTGSFAARAANGTLCGAVLTTSIELQTAHIAQLVVAPSHWRQGLGRRLLDAACTAAAVEGRRYVTLLVAEDNDAARALYGCSAFEERSKFLFGWRSRPIPRGRS